jgi:hypothetical protein
MLTKAVLRYRSLFGPAGCRELSMNKKNWVSFAVGLRHEKYLQREIHTIIVYKGKWRAPRDSG